VGVSDVGKGTTAGLKGLAERAGQPFRAELHLMYVADLCDASERNEIRTRFMMLQLPRREPLTEYVLRDSAGRVLGMVLAPAGGLPTGPGADDVLLIRCPSRSRRTEVPTAA
jgi:hypothetical protein